MGSLNLLLNNLIFSPNSLPRRLFEVLPYRWQLQIILAVWEVMYRHRRRRWHWAGCHLSTEMPSFGVGQPDLVSVVLPVYNHGDTLANAINSVLQQSYPKLELIIVNDGSTDDTPHILSGFEQYPNIRVVHQPNQGLPAALNKGFSLAKGVFFTWTSADNLMQPEQITQLVDYLNRHPAVALVYADFELIDEQGEAVPDAAAIFMRGQRGSPVVRPKQETERLNVGFESVVGPCFLYRSFLHPLIGTYNPELTGSEDFDYWIRINNFFVIHHLDDDRPLYRYRVHDRRMSAAIKPRISQLRRWLMKREQEFQQLLDVPLPVAIDATSSKFLANFRPPRQARPILEFVLIGPDGTMPDQPFKAILLHISSLKSDVLAQISQADCFLLCWLTANDKLPANFNQLRPQIDLVVSYAPPRIGFHTGRVARGKWRDTLRLSASSGSGCAHHEALHAPRPSVDRLLFASTPKDIYHLLRIFIASRIDFDLGNKVE